MQLAVLTASLTILGGVFVFVITQIVLKIVIQPFAEFRKVKGRINTSLIFHANVYMNPIHLSEDVNHKNRADITSNEFRILASELMASYQMLTCKHLLIWLGIIPNREKIHDASRHLIGLSNGIYTYSSYAEYKHDERKKNDSSAKELARILDLYLR
jgi:hypothetical protein